VKHVHGSFAVGVCVNNVQFSNSDLPTALKFEAPVHFC